MPTVPSLEGARPPAQAPLHSLIPWSDTLGLQSEHHASGQVATTASYPWRFSLARRLSAKCTLLPGKNAAPAYRTKRGAMR
eukprot:10726635-Heterocapsa_arctica.AAC.1